MPAYEDLTATDLLRRWRQMVNGNSTAGRDGALLKNFLVHTSPIKVLLGMYKYMNVGTISIPQFLRQSDEWLEDDEVVAKIELAIHVANKTPPEYYVWMDYKDDENALSVQYSKYALAKLTTWADGVLA